LYNLLARRDAIFWKSEAGRLRAGAFSAAASTHARNEAPRILHFACKRRSNVSSLSGRSLHSEMTFLMAVVGFIGL
jgi:hypothetical protein